MRKKKLTENFGFKVFSFVAAVFLFLTAAVGTVGAVWLWSQGYYTKSLKELHIEAMEDVVQGKSYQILEFLAEEKEEYVESYLEGSNLTYMVLGRDDEKIVGNITGEPEGYVFMLRATQDQDSGLIQMIPPNADGYKVYAKYAWYDEVGAQYLGEDKTLYLCIDEELKVRDNFQDAVNDINIRYDLRYLMIIVAGSALLLHLLCFIFLLYAAGKRYQKEAVSADGVFRIPFDMLTAAVVFIWIVLLFALDEVRYNSELTVVGGIVLLVTLAWIVFMIYCMVWAIQVRAGIWWKNTLICRFLVLCRRFGRFLRRALKAVLHNIPELIKVLIAMGIVVVTEFVFFLIWGMDPKDMLFIWFVEKLFLVPFITYIALVLNKLLHASEAMAEGDFSYHVDTKWMMGDLKEQGQNLNRIADGMNVAIEERLKSERLKTELITNVSHDIKTPLTSIINYADLIGEEPTENEKITEYAQVLKRHSTRLKKLIEDLMEASKASTGNVEVQMVPCQVDVFLTQTVGEYEQRLEEQELRLVTVAPKEPVYIMADGKLMWRIFDNLMNNICKYAMRGTRVYLTVEQVGEKVKISFKNISRYQLEVSAQDLMERFVRGDRSRNTEGNGLGLSITQSLTQLQGGELELTVDGDFFKAVLIFDALKQK